jgi:hypothetical protein
LAQLGEHTVKKNLKIYIVDGGISVRFGVSATNESDAKRVAKKLVKKLMESEALGSVGWSFDLEQVREAKPV